MTCDTKTPQFISFLNGVIKISDDYVSKNYKSLDLPKFNVMEGARYIRIFREGGAHVFVDKTNGDVLKPASWKAPAKHARGNIFDVNNGLSNMGPYGAAYLK